ncbi:ATP-binding protein [Clostridium oryzae]|uniref:histidine kinase n=1 Tax=Clostridium oryzae TaxID=1450648 RepID=A0A1V4IQ70_9CLOT|nr:ATP-binding protein [Clostridium oryzae]OPJ61954.1 sensor histidine kinase TmoS [Clostridium oryzae]
MNSTSENVDDNVLKMLSVLKMSIVAFLIIMIYMDTPEYYKIFRARYDWKFNLYTIGLLLLLMGLIYAVWILINFRLNVSTLTFKISWTIENAFFALLICSPIYLCTTYDNVYKYLFLLLIISSVIQYGLKYGIMTALFSSGCVLGADLLYAPEKNGINVYFQKDLILVGVFIFVAWVLGYYVELENENKNKKDKQLRVLNDELQEQNSERLIFEESLLKNKICYDILFENAQNAIIVHSNGLILYANKSAARLFGYQNPMKLNGKSVYDHCNEKNIQAVSERFSNIVSNKLSKVTYEEDIINCRGDSISVRNTSSYFIYDGEASVLTFLLDITSEKQIELLKHDVEENLRLLNKSREFNTLITEFFTNISHEFKTPVNVISVAVQTMNLYLNDFNVDNIDKFKVYLKMIKQNCFRMTRLINNLMDITKVDSGFIKLNKKNDNIVSVVEDITQSVAAYVKSKNIELVFDTDVEEKIMAFDHDKIERVILNLLSNAFKYTNADGHIFVTIKDLSGQVSISVKDDGEGIPKDMLNIIFERFGQANRSLSRQCEGTGIGLYLVKTFVKMHGGTISVFSEEKQGCEFRIILPADKVENEAAEESRDLYKSNVDKINIEFSDVYSVTI